MYERMYNKINVKSNFSSNTANFMQVREFNKHRILKYLYEFFKDAVVISFF